MFQEFFAEEIVITLSMWLFLGLAAWFDANGKEVPDALTVPYAILGATTALMKSKYVLATLTAAAVIFILQPNRPKIMTKLDIWASGEFGVGGFDGGEGSSLARRAKDFSDKYEGPAAMVATALYIITAIALPVAACIDEWPPQSALAVITGSGGLLLYMRWQMVTSRECVGKGTPNSTLIGGADAIVLTGMLGFYGGGPWIYGMAVSLIALLLYALVLRIATRRKVISVAALPIICFLAPVRLLIAITICAGRIGV